MNDRHLLYLLGPSSKQNVRVKVASSSKNSVANASHQRLSLSCNTMQGCKYCPLPENLSAATTTRKCVVSLEREACFDNIIVAAGIGQPECVCVYIYIHVTRAQYRSRLTRCHLDATSAPEARSFTIFPRDRDRMHRVVCTCLTLPPARNYTALSSPIISATTRRFSIRARKTR